MISPFSISSALSMTLNGATGETYEAMIEALGFEGKTLLEINETYKKLMTEMVPVDDRVVVDIANSVWVEKRLDVKQPFMITLRDYFKAEALSIDILDPDAVEKVNSWIEEKTHDKIVDMLDYLDPDLAMLLINAVYFNGKWKYQFNKDDTKDEPFYVAPEAPETVPMMHQTTNLNTIKKDNFRLVEIPYGQGNYTMVVMLPDDNVSIGDVSVSITPALWNEWMDELSGNIFKVELSMPRFKFEYKRLLNQDLFNLGMSIAFSDDADFKNISDQELKISRVLHQTFIETNEEGTEAAAATVVEIVFKTSDPGTTVLKIDIDHPFLFFIREVSTGTILFAGKVSDPI
jgi:serpin B